MKNCYCYDCEMAANIIKTPKELAREFDIEITEYADKVKRMVTRLNHALPMMSIGEKARIIVAALKTKEAEKILGGKS